MYNRCNEISAGGVHVLQGAVRKNSGVTVGVAVRDACPNANPTLPANNLQDLIALAKAKPGQLNYGSGGSGTVTHLAGEFFNMQAGVKTQHIPYKGSIPALTDTVGGQIHMYYRTTAEQRGQACLIA